MPKFEGRFVSIVLLGKHNPQILNHDFLVRNSILPSEDQPFRDFLAKEEGEQFSQFISTPPMTTISYGPVSIVVDEGRYQIADRRFPEPSGTTVVDITKRYFGKCLCYTPFTAGGINFNGRLHFQMSDDEAGFDRRLGLDRERLSELAQTEDVRVGTTISFPCLDGSVEVQVAKPKLRPEPATLNFNYEFGYTGDMDSFLANLDSIAAIYGRLMRLLDDLGVER